jgi:hypothetical protein
MKDIEENLIPDKIKEEDYNKIKPILSGLLKKLNSVGTFELN